MTGTDGNGCGAYGRRGTYEGAVNDVKSKAHAMSADYVQIFNITEPHFRPGCFDNHYVISGNAYKSSPSIASPQGVSLEDRLSELKGLHVKGLITDTDYEQQKKRILDEQLSR